MKKIITLLLAFALSVGVCGCVNTDTTEKSNEIVTTENSTESEKKENIKHYSEIDGYEYANFEKYNSYAEDNGLGDTPVYIKGTVKSVSENKGICISSIASEDGGKWLVVFAGVKYTDEIKDILDEETITCFGTYQGFSDIFQMPAIFVDKVKVDNKTYENKDLIALSEPVQSESTTEKATVTEPVTESEDKSTNKVIFDNNGIKVIYTGIEKDNFYTRVKMYIENNSNTDYTIQARDVSVNGYMMDPVFSCEVKSGKKANDTMDFFNSDFDENNIESLSNIEFYLHIFNWDNNEVDFDSEMISFEL